MQKRYPEIADLIAREYLTGTSSDRLPGSARLADRFGVNQRTVMRALQLLEKKNLVTICGTSGVYPAREQKPVCKRNGILVIVGVGSTSELAGFIREKLATTGFRPVFLDFSPEVFEENPAFVRNFSADGFLFRFSKNFNLEIEKYLCDLKIPYVLLNRGNGTRQIDSSSNDLEMGWALILDHLLKQGCRRIMFLDNKSFLPQYEERLQEIFRTRLGDRLFGGKCFFTDCCRNPEKTINALVDELPKLPEPPDAIVTGSGWLAIALLKAFPPPRRFLIGASWDGNDLPPRDLLCAFHDAHDRVGWALDRLILRISGDTQPSEHHISPVRIQIPEPDQINTAKKKGC